MMNAIVERPISPRLRMPKIVEYQCGSSDMTQSVLMNVMTITHSTRPGPDSMRNRRSCGPGGSAGCWSCSRDHLLRKKISVPQMTK